ncbi:MAG: InlB B-repeat-containing protein [Bacteroidales bacterium]|nr:InlB B-repeat-containing protein [Bacteroidales bacterium]
MSNKCRPTVGRLSALLFALFLCVGQMWGDQSQCTFTQGETIYFDMSGCSGWSDASAYPAAVFYYSENSDKDTKTNGTELYGKINSNSWIGNTNYTSMTSLGNNKFSVTIPRSDIGYIQIIRISGVDNNYNWNHQNRMCVDDAGTNNCIYCDSWDNSGTWTTYNGGRTQTCVPTPVPYDGNLYVIGRGVKDWTLPGQEMTKVGNGIYTWTGELGTNDEGFKFNTKNGWSPKYAAPSEKYSVSVGTEYPLTYYSGESPDYKFVLSGSQGTYTVTVDLSDKNHGKMSITSSAPASGRTYDGTEYMYFNAGAVSWWCNDGVEQWAYFKDMSGNETKVVGDVVEEKIYRFLVPAGEYQSVKESRQNHNYTGEITLKGTTQNYIQSFLEGGTTVTWGTYNPPVPIWKIKGSFDNWAEHEFSGSGTTVTYTYNLAANMSYNFVVMPPSGSDFKNKDFTSGNNSHTLEQNGNDASIQTTTAGDYVFTLDYSTANSPKLTITYPSAPTLPYEYYMTGDLWDVCKGFNGYSKDEEAWTNAGSDDNLPFMAHMVKNGGEASISFVAPKVQFRFDIEEYQRTNTVNNIKINPTGNLGDKATRSSEKYKVNLRDISSITGPSIITVTYNGSGVTINQQPYTPNPSAYAGWKVLLYKDTDGNNETEVGSLDANGQFVTDELTNGTKYRLRITDGTGGKLCGINWFGGLYFDQTSGTDIVTYPTQTYHGSDNTKFDPSSWPVAYKYNATGVFTMKENGKLQITFDGGKITINKVLPKVHVTFETFSAQTVQQQEVNVGGKATNPGNLNAIKTQEGNHEVATFGGWYADAACTQTFDFSSIINQDTKVYAKWNMRSEDFYIVGDLWMNDGTNWKNGNNPKFTKNSDNRSMSVTYIAPMGTNRFEVIRGNDWGYKVPMDVDPNSPIQINVADGHMNFNLTKIQEVTVTYNGRFSVSSRDYTPTFVADMFITGDSWGTMPDGTGMADWSGQDHQNQKLTNDNGIGAIVVRNVSANTNHQFKIYSTPGDNSVVGLQNFNAPYVDLDNKPTELSWQMQNSVFGHQIPMNDNYWRNITFQVSKQMDLKITFDGGTVRINEAPSTVDDDYYIFGAGGTNWVNGWSSAKWFDEYKMTSDGTVASKTFQYVKGSCLFKIWKKSTGNEELKNANIDNSHEGANLKLEADGTTDIKFNLGDTYSDVTIYTDGKKVWASKTNSDTNKKKVMFNLSNGNWPIPVQLVENGGKVTKPTDPIKSNNSFVDWYQNADFTGSAFDFANTTINSDITLYAKWNYMGSTYYVVGSFLGNPWDDYLAQAIPMTNQGDHIEGTINEIYKSEDVLQFRLKPNLTQGDWNNCINWDKFNSNRSDRTNVTYDKGDADVNVKATFSGDKYYRVTVCYDGVAMYAKLTEVTMRTVRFYALNEILETRMVENNTTTTAPSYSTPDGYTFLGWYDNASFTGDQFNFSTPITEDKNIYAKVLKHVISITVTAAGGVTEIMQGQTLQMSKTVTPADYQYGGPITWSTSDAQIATITSEGLLSTGTKTGAVMVHATAANGIQGQYEVTVNPSACDAWKITYWKQGDGRKTEACFVKAKPDDANDHMWYCEFTLPNAADWFAIGHASQPTPKSIDWTFNGITTIGLQSNSDATKYYPGQDAVGYLRIYDNSTDDNYYVAFEPTYQALFGIEGGSDPWTVLDFHNTTGHEYETNLFKVPAGYKSNNDYKYYVGTKRANNTSQFIAGKSSTDKLNTVGGLSSEDRAGQYGVFHINANWNDKNWYCEFIPYYTYELRNDADEIIYVAPGCPANATEAEKSTFIYNENLPTKTGYTQIGWSRSIGGEKLLDLGAEYSYWKSPDIFYPVWQAKTYTVTLMNGDQKVRDVTATYNADMPAMGDKPTKTGYTFAGFYTEQGGQGTQYYNGTGESTHVYDTDGNMILYAHWTINQYTVSWVTDGDALTGDYTQGMVNFGTTIVAPNTPTKTGYTFATWTPTVDATVPDYDVTYTATWNMIAIEDVTLNQTTATLKPDDTQELTATVLPAGVIYEVIWTSSDEAVATVDDNGLVTAGSEDGEAIITCTATNTVSSQTATCTVTVSACSYAYKSIYTNTITDTTTTTVAGSVGGSGSVANLFNPTSQTEPATFTTARLQIGRDNSETYYAYYNGTEDDYLYATESTTEPTITWRIDQVESKTGVYYIHTTDDKYIYIDKSKQLSDNGGWPTYAPRVGDFDSDDKDKFQWQLGTTGDGNYPHILSLNSQYSLHRRHWSVDWLWKNAPEHVVACGGDINQGSGKYEDFVSMFVKSDGTQGTEESPNPNYKQSPVNSSYYRFASGATMTSTVTGGLKESDKIIVYCYNPGSAEVTGTLTIDTINETITIPADSAFTYEYDMSADANNDIVVVSDNIDFCVSYVEVQRNLPKEYIDPTITWTPEPVSAMTVGQTYTSVATATGKGAITYTSSNTDVATVDAYGTVRPISNGSVTITATVAAHDCYNSVSDSYTVTVTGGKDPSTINFTTLPTDAPQGSVQTVVVETDGGANFNLTIVGDPGATLEFVSQEEKRIEAKVKVRATASNITLRATTDADASFAATSKDATLTVSACDPDGDNIFIFTMAGTDDAAGQTADGVIGGTVNQSDLATVGTEDNPVMVDMITAKTRNAGGKYIGYDGGVKVVEGTGDNTKWYMIPAGRTATTSWGDKTYNLYYLYNKDAQKYLYRNNEKYADNGDWPYYTTDASADASNARATDDKYTWFVCDGGNGSKLIVCGDGIGSEQKSSYHLHTANQSVDVTNSHAAKPAVPCGRSTDINDYSKIDITTTQAANPVMIKSVEYNSKTYYLLGGGTVTVNCPLKAGDKITLDRYNRNTCEDASTTITLDADANSYSITDGGNHYLYLHSITIWRDQIGEMVTPTLSWDADLTKPVMVANGGTVTHVATSDVTTIETITYTSSNPDVATVAADGTVTMAANPVSAPTTITATLQGVGCYNTATRTYVVIPTTNIFNHSATTMYWSDPDNWSSKVLPDAETDVIIQAKAIVDINTAAAKTVVIDDNGHDAEIEILSTGALQVEGTITRTDGKASGPTTIHDLYIHSDDTGTGALVFNNSNNCQAYVEMFSKAYTDGVKYWQYLGAPVSGTNLNVDFYGAYTYSYAESNGWTRVKTGEMTPWIGWGITQSEAKRYVLSGTLQPTNNTKTFDLTYTKEGAEGCNLIANSWMAPIDITKMETSDFGEGATATIYMYNTGRDKSETEVIYGEGTDKTPGQWVTIPVETAKQDDWKGPKAIPAMQAFEVDVTKNTTLTLNYNTVVRHKDAAIGTNPLRTPARKADNEDAVSMMRIRVEGQNMHVDQYLLEGENFTTGFDNGWDGNHVEGDGRSAGFYSVNTELGDMAVNALPEIEGTLLGFVPNDEQAFTISFGYNGDKTYYLNDLLEEKSTLIRNDQTYFFLVGGNDIVHRFQISTTPFESYIGTGSDNIGNGVQKAVKFIENDKLFILRNGHLYDGTGKALKPGK